MPNFCNFTCYFLNTYKDFTTVAANFLFSLYITCIHLSTLNVGCSVSQQVCILIIGYNKYLDVICRVCLPVLFLNYWKYLVEDRSMEDHIKKKEAKSKWSWNMIFTWITSWQREIKSVNYKPLLDFFDMRNIDVFLY